MAEFQPGEWLGLHRHAPTEVYYVFAGAGLMSLDGREFPIKTGSTVFIPGMAEHGVRQTGGEILRLFYAFPSRFVRRRRIPLLRRAALLTIVGGSMR